MNTVSYAHVDVEGKIYVFIREPEGILLSKKTKVERERELKKYRQYFPDNAIVLFHEDEWGVRTLHCNNTLANKLAKWDISQCVWQTISIE